MRIPSGNRALIVALSFSSYLLPVTSLFANSFTAGDLVVTRVGSGGSSLNSNAAPVYLDEYTIAGILVQSLALPTTTGGSTHALTLSGTSLGGEGQLQLSPDGTTLSVAGYAQATGTAINSSSATTNRVVATINSAGTVATNTVINTGAVGGVRSVITNGSTAWLTTDSGLQQVTLGTAGGSTQVSTTLAAPRVVSIYNGQLYVSGASNPGFGVDAVGTGLPVSSGQVETELPGFSLSGSQSAYDFVFANDHTIYVTDDGISDAGGGIQRWVFDSGAWVRTYIITNVLANGVISSQTAGFRSIAGETVNGNFVLYATSNTGRLYSINDTGTAATSSVSLLVDHPVNTFFRGVEFVPALPADPTGTAAPAPSSLATLATLGLYGLVTRRKRT